MPRRKKQETKEEVKKPKEVKGRTKSFKERCDVCGESFSKGDFLTFFDKNGKGRIICYDCYSAIKDIEEK